MRQSSSVRRLALHLAFLLALFQALPLPADGLGLSGLVGSAWAAAPTSRPDGADFPSRPVTLVIPYAQGGPTDQVARPLARELSRVLGREAGSDQG